jgi:hypothetical protein
MRLSTWHRTFQTWVQDLLLTSDWGVELPELDDSTRAHLPPFTSISYEPRGNRLTYFNLEQQLFHYQRLPYSLLYEQISLNDIEGFYGTISYSLANRWGEISSEIENLTLKSQDEPIIIREIGDNRGYWFVQLSWTFDMTAELEPEEPDDTYLDVDFGVNYKLWTVEKLDSSDLLPRFPDFPADLPGVITIQLSPTLEYQVILLPRTIRTSSVIAPVNVNVTSPVTYLTQENYLVEFISANGRTASASMSTEITLDVEATAGNNTVTSVLVEWAIETDYHLIVNAGSPDMVVDIHSLDLVPITIRNATSLAEVQTVVAVTPTVSQDQTSAFLGLLNFSLDANSSKLVNQSEEFIVEVSTIEEVFITKLAVIGEQLIEVSTEISGSHVVVGSDIEALIVLTSTSSPTIGIESGATVEIVVTANGSVAGVAPATLLFDSYPNPTGWGAAFTRLSSTYTGDCCKVRNSVSLTEYTIGFSGNVIDEAALLAAYEGNNSALLYLVEWYDQTGNGTVGVAVEDLNNPAQGFPPIIGDLNQTLVKFNGEQYIKFTDSPPCAFKTMWANGTDKLPSVSIYGRAQIFNNSNGYTFYIYHRNLSNQFGRLFFGTDDFGNWYTRQNRSGIRTYSTVNDEQFHNYCWRSSLGDMDIFIDDVSIGGMFVSSNLAEGEDDFTLNASFGAAAHASNQGQTNGSYFNEQAIRYVKYHVIYDTVDNATDVAAKNALLNQ